MKERPILFSAPMVRAILDGRKTQTRRVVKPQPGSHHWEGMKGHKLHVSGPHALDTGLLGVRFQHSIPQNPIGERPIWATCKFGQPGDHLWVRETWGLMCYHDPTDWCSGSIKGITEAELRERYTVEHAANWKLPSDSAHWRPSIHMPRWASRITLEIAGVRVERLQDIRNEDCWGEGMCDETNPDLKANRKWFSELWESINGPGSWDANPWVWVIEFRRVKP